jgi:hypothetical protein
LATYDGISAVSKAIVGLLADSRDTFSFNEDAPPNFALFHASDYEHPKSAGADTNARFSFPGVSLCLYRVSLNTSMRNASRQSKPDGQTYRAPMPLDLFYLLTAWADDVEMQQRLLGWSMRVLHDTPILPAALINKHSPDVAGGVFRAGEHVELTNETLSFQDSTTIWDRLRPKMQTSVTYIARMVMIESTKTIEDAAPVQTRLFERVPQNGSPH